MKPMFCGGWGHYDISKVLSAAPGAHMGLFTVPSLPSIQLTLEPLRAPASSIVDPGGLEHSSMCSLCWETPADY